MQLAIILFLTGCLCTSIAQNLKTNKNKNVQKLTKKQIRNISKYYLESHRTPVCDTKDDMESIEIPVPSNAEAKYNYNSADRRFDSTDNNTNRFTIHILKFRPKGQDTSQE